MLPPHCCAIRIMLLQLRLPIGTQTRYPLILSNCLAENDKLAIAAGDLYLELLFEQSNRVASLALLYSSSCQNQDAWSYIVLPTVV